MPLIRPEPSVFALLEAVAGGEGLCTEFKRLVHSPAKIARSITAFANTAGGHILVGVDDDRRIVGISSEKEVLEVIDDALRLHIEPAPTFDVHVEEFKRRMVLVISIPESNDKPHFHIEEVLCRKTGRRVIERRVYIREGSHNRAATDDRVALIQSARQPLKLTFSDRERRLLHYLGENPRITASEFAEHAGIPLGEARRILVSLVRSGAIRLLTDSGTGVYALA
ncbi:MAG: helix-turn-helix domain-containing protein [Chlorobiaceae bacterium]|nr:helix-turn-helix domain-containing protein [Chlorobiaceae bacterium]NTV26927.1 helix-turn-helix domain-containing protein [Chlorobiaceae bacterium]